MKLVSVFMGIFFIGITSAFGYTEIDVTNGGTISGKVMFKGRVPTRLIIPTKNKEVCGGKRKEPRILVGADKGVQEAAVYLKKVKKGKAWGTSEALPIIDQKKCRFVPHVQIMPKGELEIVNSDPVLHNTHGYLCKKNGKNCKRTVFNVALPNQGQKIKQKLKRPGLVKVDCDAHGWMLGWIQVVDNPYYTLSGEDGSFTITDVPPGKYTLVVFQGYIGVTETPIEIKANEVASLTIQLKK